MLGCLLAWSGPSFSDVAHNEYPDTDLGIRLTRDPMPTWTGWSVPWPALELFLTRMILAPQSRHLRGRSRAATASWMLWTKQRRHNAWWPQGETCITDRAWQQTMHASSWEVARSNSSLDMDATSLSILLCSLLISSCVASCRFFSGSSVCNFSYFLAFRPTPIKGANRPEKGPGGMMSDVSVRRLFPVMVKCSFGRALDRYQHANNMV